EVELEAVDAEAPPVRRAPVEGLLDQGQEAAPVQVAEPGLKGERVALGVHLDQEPLDAHGMGAHHGRAWPPQSCRKACRRRDATTRSYSSPLRRARRQAQ